MSHVGVSMQGGTPFPGNYRFIDDRPLPHGTGQIINAAMARGLHADAYRNRALVAWVVMFDLPAYPERFAARLATKRLSPYVLLADTLVGIQEQLPPGLVRAERQPSDLPEVVEIWFA